MRIVRYMSQDGPAFGVVEDEAVYVLQGDLFGSWNVGRRISSLDAVQILAPVVPSKIVAIGKNYLEHAQEMHSDVPEEPLIFLKPPTAIVAHLDAIVYPTISQRVDHEGELAVIIGQPCYHVEPAQARAFVLGYTCANDVTARDLQRHDDQWGRAKCFDTFCPIGPWIATQEVDPGNAHVVCEVNGELRQSANTNQMTHSVADLIAYISDIMTLLPGDVILTGTPAGIGPVVPGDLVEITVPGIGTLRNEVVLRD